MSLEGLKTVFDPNNRHLGGNGEEGDPFTFAPSVWTYVIERFAVKSVLDFGSGMGHAARWFYLRGLDILAVDGLPYNAKNALYPTVCLDVTKGPVICSVDLVHCQEVVEHIEERFLENLIKTLACGKIILMTNALPGQTGHHHVNEQPTEYWINHLQRHGCLVMREDTDRIRTLARQTGASYLASTGVLLRNRQVPI
jgi:hypothetical protein